MSCSPGSASTSPTIFCRRYARSVPPGRSGESHSRSEEHTSELQSRENLVCRLLLEKKKILIITNHTDLHTSITWYCKDDINTLLHSKIHKEKNTTSHKTTNAETTHHTTTAATS